MIRFLDLIFIPVSGVIGLTFGQMLLAAQGLCP